MSNDPYYIYLDLDPYLAQWFVHDSGGTQPVELRKLSTERRILEVFLQKLQLWNDLHYHGYIGRRRDNLIYAWMDAHGIELTETNWNTIAKIYIRQYKNYLQREQYKKKQKNIFTK